MQTRDVAQLLVIGMEGAGKTTIIKHLVKSSPGVEELICPTPFINIQKIALPRKTIPCIVYDISGHGRYRHTWSYFYAKVDGIFFVVDSTDTERLSIAKELIDSCIADPCLKMRRIPFMILCTKNDLPDAVNVREIMKILEYDKLKQNPYLYVEMKSVNGLSGLNTDEALSFFNFYIKSK